MEKVSKKKANKVLKNLLLTISVDNPTVEDSYARRYRESIKAIFGDKSDFYDSATKINFLYAFPGSNNKVLSENDPKSSCGIARDLLKGCLKHLENFDTYSPPKKNYFDELSNWKIITIISGVAIGGFIAGWTLGSILNLFVIIGHE
jgi:hypothetical protein